MVDKCIKCYAETVTGCPHTRMRSTAVILRDSAGTPEGIALAVHCETCGSPFEFAGVETTKTMLVSEDRREVRMLIAESLETQKPPAEAGGF